MVEVVSYDEYEELIQEMDKAFDVDFKKILPKLYYKDNKKMIHFCSKENGKIVSSVGLYEEKMISPYGTLKVGIMGAVSTLPEYRGKGYMSKEINTLIDYAKNHKYDMLILGGDRIRYSHFGFEYAGRRINGLVTKRSMYLLNSEDYEIVSPTSKEDYEYILRMYKRRKQYFERDINMLDKILASWESKPYLVKVNNRNIGYFCLSKDESTVLELAYDKQYLDTMLRACLGNREAINIQLCNDDFNEEVLSKLHRIYIDHDYSYKILNLENVMEYMDIDLKYKSQYEKLDDSKLVRTVLGDLLERSKHSKLKYINTTRICHG